MFVAAVFVLVCCFVSVSFSPLSLKVALRTIWEHVSTNTTGSPLASLVLCAEKKNTSPPNHPLIENIVKQAKERKWLNREQNNDEESKNQAMGSASV